MYELINREAGLENEITENEYSNLPHYKKTKYRKKRDIDTGAVFGSHDSTGISHGWPTQDYSTPSYSDPEPSFGGFHGGDGGGAGASGGWDSSSDSSSSYDSSSCDSSSSSD